MKWTTHRLIGAGTAIFIDGGLVAAALSYAGSTLPDVVEGKPPQEGAFFFNSGMRSWKKSHRGSSHWFGWYLVIAIAGFTYSPILAWIGIGALTHLAADALTPMGVPLYPFSKKKMLSINLFPTGGFREFIFGITFAGILLYYMLHARNTLTVL